MRIVFRFLLGTLKNAFVLVPSSALIAFGIWFFSNVVFGNDWSYLVLWRNAYLITLGVIVAIEFVATILWLISVWLVTLKIDRSFNRVEEAIVVYKLNKEKPLSQWTAQWFDEAMTRKEAIRAIAEAFVKVISNR